MRGVPSGPQVAEGAYGLIKAVPHANSRRVQKWIGDRRTQRIITRILNMGPDLVDRITRDIPLMEIIRFKAEILGKTEMLKEVNLPPDATGWMFNGSTLMEYVDALRELGVMLPKKQHDPDVGERCNSIYVAGNRVYHSHPTFFDPLEIHAEREVPPYNPPFADRIGGGGAGGLIDILDHALNHAVRATLLCGDVTKMVLAAFHAHPRKNGQPINFCVSNVYTEGVSWPQERWRARKIVPYLYTDCVGLRRDHRCLCVRTVDSLEYKALKLETMYTQIVCDEPLNEPVYSHLETTTP